ncbi:MAG: hydroxyacid dehydrogenase [Smithellaceae bacterium]|nr:hydroxyacid dehydrogenase [Smithellaceae bacterium]
MSLPKRILLPQPIEEAAMRLLIASKNEIILAPDPSPETILTLIRDVQGMVLRTGIKITRELMGQGRGLRVIARTGAGVDNVDVAAATERGILVTSVPGANTLTVVEHSIALFLSLMKQLPLMDREVRRDNFGIRFQNIPRDLNGKTLGLVGFGRIGSELGRICRDAFSMVILAYDPYILGEAKIALSDKVEFCDLERLFRESDIISLHLPLLPGTQKLIGATQLNLMKPDAFLVNTSRGGVLDEDALILVLKERRIAGAGLDVFAQEPLAKDNQLKNMDNVILTPHTAALTRECVSRLALQATRAVLDVLNGKIPAEGVVNPEVLSSSRWRGASWI